MVHIPKQTLTNDIVLPTRTPDQKTLTCFILESDEKHILLEEPLCYAFKNCTHLPSDPVTGSLLYKEFGFFCFFIYIFGIRTVDVTDECMRNGNSNKMEMETGKLKQPTNADLAQCAISESTALFYNPDNLCFTAHKQLR